MGIDILEEYVFYFLKNCVKIMNTEEKMQISNICIFHTTFISR